MSQHHPANQDFYAPWGKIPTIQPACPKNDLHFIRPQKKHLFLEHIAREIHQRFYTTDHKKVLWEKWPAFFQHFQPLNPLKNFNLWDDSPPKHDDSMPLFANGYDNALLDEMISLLRPWRKGPFHFYNKTIHSEWQSQKKWQRLKKALDALSLPSLKDGDVLDIGCNNAYYLFRLLAEKNMTMRKIVGIEPTNNYFLQYLFLMRIFGSIVPNSEKIHYFPIGYQMLPTFFQPTFSLILCMGILYHHPHPLEIVEITKNLLQTGGWVIFEVQGMENITNNATNDEQKSLPLCLFPEKTYTGKKGFWFLPTLNALTSWLKRCGFKKIIVADSCPLTTEEQQSNQDSPFDSLEQGLNEKKNQTLEGYPPPYRHIVMAQK